MPDPINQLVSRLTDLERATREADRSSGLAQSSVDDGALAVTADGRLRALIGQQPDGTTAVTVVNGPVPPTPSRPNAAPVLGGVRVGWDGTFTGGQPCPLDFARVEVHAAPATGFTPSAATLVTTIETPQGGTAVIPARAAVWALLVTRSTSGTASPASAETTAAPAKVVADEVLAGVIGELQLAAAAVTAAKLAVGAVTTPALAAGSVTAGQLAAGAVAAGKIAADAITGREIKALSITADKIAANTIAAGQLAAGAVTATTLSADAIDGKTIKGATITGGTVQTGTTGARVVINPDISWIPGTTMPAVLLYTGIAGEKSPGTVYADPIAGRLSQQAPHYGYGRAYLDLNSSVTATELGHIELGTGDKNSPNLYIGGTGRSVIVTAFPAAGSAATTYTFNDRELAVEAWQPVQLASGISNFGGWRPAQLRRMPDGTCQLRGIIAIPAGQGNGRIGTIPAANCRPKAGEVLLVACDTAAKVNLFVYPDGRLELGSASGPLGNWISFGHSRWGTD
ncbi:hypothetical protein GCM10009760_16300 [Kitasatospora kazusensis]|uniref:Uncharacterized protein n=1 Tax=Kitasatospora kazusensis TaxID=407974 RepID=A0ABP5KVE4_9ACTN